MLMFGSALAEELVELQVLASVIPGGSTLAVTLALAWAMWCWCPSDPSST